MKLDKDTLRDLVDEKLPRFQVLEGRFDPNLTGWPEAGWRAEVRPFDAGPQPGPMASVLDQVALEIWWNAAGQRKTYKLEGYRRTWRMFWDLWALWRELRWRAYWFYLRDLTIEP